MRQPPKPLPPIAKGQQVVVLPPDGGRFDAVVVDVYPAMITFRCPSGFLRSVPRNGTWSRVNGWRLVTTG